MESLERRPGVTSRVRVVEFREGTSSHHEDRLVTEEPLEIRLAWPGHPAERVAVTMRTPGHDFELAAGLLYSEGLLDPASLHTVAYCTDSSLRPEQEMNVVTAQLADAPARPVDSAGGVVATRSSACGVCGTESIEQVLALCEVRRRSLDVRVPVEVLHRLPARLRDAQSVFERTGALHAAGLFDQTGSTLVVREDVGRHNAVDKAVGARLLGGADTAVPVLCVSGRVGFEIVQKAAAAGIGLVAAIGAPTSLAVRLAEDAGICLVGFLGSERFVAYSCVHKLGES